LKPSKSVSNGFQLVTPGTQAIPTALGQFPQTAGDFDRHQGLDQNHSREKGRVVAAFGFVSVGRSGLLCVGTGRFVGAEIFGEMFLKELPGSGRGEVFEVVGFQLLFVFWR
jgi:hypothetical protein